MKITFLTLVLLLFTASCSSPAPKQQKTAATEKPEEVVNDISYEANLEAYREFISSLDSTKAETVTLAAGKFKELFEGEGNGLISDLAFVDFDKYYEKVGRNIQNQMDNNSSLEEAQCQNYDENGKKLPLDKNLKKFISKIEKHGFRLECEEGYPFIGRELKILENYFFDLVSPVMKAYLIQVKHENDQWFSSDAGIIISDKEFVDRTVFWEKFAAENPDFILVNNAKENYKYLLTYLFIGMDNTPSIGFDTRSGMYDYASIADLDGYFADAYIYLNKKYPKSETNKLVKPFFAAAKIKDAEKINKLLDSYKKQGKINTFDVESVSE